MGKMRLGTGLMAAMLYGMAAMPRTRTGLGGYAEAIDEQKSLRSLPTGHPVDIGSGRLRSKKNTPSKRQRSLALKA